MPRAGRELGVAVAELLAGWGVKASSSPQRLSGGDLNDVFRVDTRTTSLALRVYGEGVPRSLVEPGLVHVVALARALPFVPAPIPTPAGALVVERDGLFASLTAFVAGTHLKREESALAAATLARIHEVGASSPDERRAWAWTELAEGASHSWAIERSYLENLDLPDGLDARTLVERIESGLLSSRRALTQLREVRLPMTVVHGDFYPRNIIVDDGRVAGVVDWDDARVDWRVWDVASASREFGSAPNASPVDSVAARDFIRAYELAGSPLTAAERAAILPVLRARLLWETLHEIAEARRGHPPDWGYLWANLTCADHLEPGDLG